MLADSKAMEVFIQKVKALEMRIKELEEENATLRVNFDKMVETADAHLFTYLKEKKRVKELEEGIGEIEKMGHNDDCLMCAQKDFWARGLINKEKP